MISLEIPHPPIPWKRARRNKGIYFDEQKPQKTAFCWEVKARLKAPITPSTGFSLVLGFYVPTPPSLSLKEAEKRFNQNHTQKPDLDNYVKFVLDALNGLIWKDDSQIHHLQAYKKWSAKGKTLIGIMPSE